MSTTICNNNTLYSDSFEFLSSMAAWQASGADILSIVTSINDIFDTTNQKYKEHIAALNKHASGYYSEVSKGLQVGFC